MLGIMQGRLVPPHNGSLQCFPRERWQDEFALARQAGLECIEWLYDASDGNPLDSDAGIAEIRAVSSETGILVRSLCAHVFIEKGFDARLLGVLMGRMQALGGERIILPLVEMPSEADVEAVRRLVAEQGIEIGIETPFAPAAMAGLVRRFDHPQVRVNYDCGNSTGSGYDVREEFAAYGYAITSVHLKEKLRGGASVPLGEGDVDWARLAALLGHQGYRGGFILEAQRGRPGDELAHVRRYVDFVRQRLC